MANKPKLYASVGGKAKLVKKIYTPVNGKAKSVLKIYRGGADGRAKLVWQQNSI